ncbi:ArsC family reductase [Pseudaeromonas sp. ZJS20]|uniref:ArsC family reductase n=1 Tax=Pseudaeromonas aegiceratis TaxID=3153928 RepID=UPI00390C7823
MIRVYGIRQCDTLKKALRWLDEQQIPYAYHDYRKDGLSPELLQEFIDALGWEALFNKRGTTYRQLDDATKQALDAKLAFEVMLAQPAIIKRPLLLKDGQYTLGFSEAQYRSLFA